MKKILFAAVMLSLYSLSLSTQGVRLENTVISESNFETDIISVPKNITVITAQEIEERGAQNLGEVLKAVPSLTVYNAGGSDTVFDLRGQGDTSISNVLVLLDGAPINSIDLSGYKTSMIDVSSIQRVEVIPSGGSVLYGDGAVGGVINIITDSPQERKNYGSITLEGGSYDYGKIYGNYGTALSEKFLLRGSFSQKNIKGYREEAKDDLDDFNFSGKYLLEDGGLSLSVNRSKNSFKTPGTLKKDESEEDPKSVGDSLLRGTNRENLYTMNFNKRFGNNFEFLVYGNYSQQRYRSDKDNYLYQNSDLRNYDTDNFYIKPHIKYGYMEDSYIIVGGDFQNASTDVRSENSIENFSGKSTKESMGAFFLNKIVVNNWELTQGYRKQLIDYDYFEYKGRERKNKKFKENAFDLSANYLFSDTASLYASYITAFRTPNTDELGAWDYSYGVNPQTSQTVEIGGKNTVGNTYMTFSLFNTFTKDEIVYDGTAWMLGDDSPYGANRNLQGKNRRSGAELFFEHYLDKFTLRESFSYIDTEIKDGVYKGKEIPNVPNYLMNFGITYRPADKWILNGDLNYRGKSYAASDFENVGGKIPSYTTFDFNVRYSFTEEFIVFGGINNLFDKKYSDYIIWGWGASGKEKFYYPSNGRNFYIGTTYKF